MHGACSLVISNNLFRNAANLTVIKKVLKKAYPSGANIDQDLIKLLQKPSRREGAQEAFRGFINLFDDYLAPQLMADIQVPVDLSWGEKDPWEPIEIAREWRQSLSCIRALEVIENSGHCPPDEAPQNVNPLLLKAIQLAI